MEQTEALPALDEEDTWLTPFGWAWEPEPEYWLPMADDVPPEQPYPYPSGLP